MGIQGLFRLMKPYINPVHIQKYAGKRVGIDAYSWLHKGSYSCSLEICQQSYDNFDPKLPYLQYCMHRINLLRYYKIIPVVVFDGGRLPSKASTEDERQRRRHENLEQARVRLAQGDTRGATEFFQRAVEITPFMAYQLIQVLKKEGVEFIVAPYEADAQLAYLAQLDPKEGGISAVITEDSDLMAYGCSVVIYKMDRTGDAEEVEMDKVFRGKDLAEGVPTFRNFTQELFTGMCVLAGCDFLASVYGIGIKRAYSFVNKYKNLERVLSVLRKDKKFTVPEGYASSFKEACAIFHHARVYDMNNKCLTFLRPLPERFSEKFDNDFDFLGPELPTSMATAIAEGKVDPITMEAFTDQLSSLNDDNDDSFEILTTQIEARGTLTPKESTNPFVFLSQRRDEDDLLEMEGSALQNTRTQKRDRIDVQSTQISSQSAESKPWRESQRNSTSEKGLINHFRQIVEESTCKTKSQNPQIQEEKENLRGSLDLGVQKRVFPIPPSNNPFKKRKTDDEPPSSGKLGDLLLQKPSNRGNTDHSEMLGKQVGFRTKLCDSEDGFTNNSKSSYVPSPSPTKNTFTSPLISVSGDEPKTQIVEKADLAGNGMPLKKEEKKGILRFFNKL